MIKDELTEIERLKKRIDELEQENQYLQQIIAHMPGNVYWKNLKGAYLGCNENTARLIGVKSSAEFIGKTIYEIVNEDFAKIIDDVDSRIMQTGIPEIVEEKAYAFDGSPAIYLSHKAPLRDKKGNICGLLGVSLEISNLKKIEKALTEAKEKAEAANKAKSEFLRNISHDLRTPFNGILSFSERLYEMETNSLKKEMLECIVISTRQLVGIVNEILEFSKIEFGQLPLKEKMLDLQNISTTIKRLFAAKILEKNIDFLIEYSTDLPPVLIGDETRICRILLNLVGNALKFTENGSITLNIQLEKKLKNHAMIALSVSDTGIGISKENYDFIFEKFSRLTLADKSEYEGLGLGLYIVKKFVQELSGTIDVESTVGKGSTFTCHLPLRLG